MHTRAFLWNDWTVNCCCSALILYHADLREKRFLDKPAPVLELMDGAALFWNTPLISNTCVTHFPALAGISCLFITRAFHNRSKSRGSSGRKFHSVCFIYLRCFATKIKRMGGRGGNSKPNLTFKGSRLCQSSVDFFFSPSLMNRIYTLFKT